MSQGLVITANDGDIFRAGFSRKDIKRRIRVPRAARDFFGRLKIIEHVQLFRFGRDCLNGFDQSSCLELLG